MIVCWWSGGITSAIACKLAIDEYGAIPVFIEIDSHHPDTQRFKRDCEKWYGVEILQIQSNYKDQFETIERFKYVNGPAGARCTMMLKRKVREDWERDKPITAYVWGFEYAAAEIKRADRIDKTMPNYSHRFPLIDAELTKQNCIEIVTDAGIEIPEMYKLGFHNNNCVGCVKGGMAYWNKIRQHFPETFDRMAKMERQIGRSCLKKYFLDELPLDAGRGKPPLVTFCGATGEGCTTEESHNYFAERAKLEEE